MNRAMVKKRNYGGAAVGLYDDVSAMYTLRRPDMTNLWTTAFIRLTRSSDGQTAYVFFDGDEVDDTITLNSKINTVTNTVPTATSLGTWLGTDDATVRNWYGITPDNFVDVDKVAGQGLVANQPRIAVGGVILTKGGLPTIDFLSDTRNLRAEVNTDLDSGSAYSIFSVHNNNDNGGLGIVYNNTFTSASQTGFTLIADRRTQKFTHTIRNTASTSATNLYLVQQDTADQKQLTGIVTATTVATYYNSTLQQSQSWSGTIGNDQFEIGARFIASTSLNGTIQEITIFPSDIGAGRTTIEADINSYYTIY